MLISKRIRNKPLVWASALGGGVLWILFCWIFGAGGPLDCLLFLLCQAAAVALPGLALCKLLRLRLTPLETLAAAYGTGLVANLLLYFLFVPAGLADYLVYGAGFLCLVSAVLLFLLRSRPFCALPDSGELAAALWLAGAAALASFVLLSLSTLTPDLSGIRSYYHDTLYGVTIAAAAARGFPLDCPQMAGIPYSYHLFYPAINAVFMLITRLDAFTVVTKFSLIPLAAFHTLVVTALARRFFRQRWMYMAAAAIALFLPGQQYVHYLYKDTLGFPMGLAFGLLSLLLYLRAGQVPCRLLNRQHLLSAVFLLGCMAAKGPLAATFLFAIGFDLLIRLCRKATFRSTVACGLLYAVPFFALYFILYRAGVENTMSWSPLYSAVRDPLALRWFGNLPATLFRILSAGLYSVQIDPLLALALFVLIIIVIRNRGAEALYNITCGGLACGVFLLNAFKQTGSSEIYFLICMLPTAYLCLMHIARRLFAAQSPRRVAGVLVAAVACAGLLFNLPAIAGCYLGRETYADMGLTASVVHSRFGAARHLTADTYTDVFGPAVRNRSVTPLEYAGYCWIRDNTPPDAVIADGRYLRDSSYFYGTAFTERGFFLEGYRYATADDTNRLTPEKIRRDTFLRFFFETGDEEYLPLLAREGCDYLILSACQNPGLTLSGKYCEHVYRNDEISVYRLHPWT